MVSALIMARHALAFVNKSLETDYQTTLKVPGLRGEATVSRLSADTSGGVIGADPLGKAHPSTGPKTTRLDVSNGTSLLIPKASIVTIRY